MIELIKKSERVIKVSMLSKACESMGARINSLGEFDKWKEIETGRIQVKLMLNEIKTANGASYFFSDNSGFVASSITSDKNETLSWFKAHGYKNDEAWYKEDCGMDEETWNEWNK